MRRGVEINKNSSANEEQDSCHDGVSGQLYMATQSACDMDKNENVPETVSWENGYNSLQILPLPCTYGGSKIDHMATIVPEHFHQQIMTVRFRFSNLTLRINSQPSTVTETKKIKWNV